MYYSTYTVSFEIYCSTYSASFGNILQDLLCQFWKYISVLLCLFCKYIATHTHSACFVYILQFCSVPSLPILLLYCSTYSSCESILQSIDACIYLLSCLHCSCLHCKRLTAFVRVYVVHSSCLSPGIVAVYTFLYYISWVWDVFIKNKKDLYRPPYRLTHRALCLVGGILRCSVIGRHYILPCYWLSCRNKSTMSHPVIVHRAMLSSMLLSAEQGW